MAVKALVRKFGEADTAVLLVELAEVINKQVPEASMIGTPVEPGSIPLKL